MTDPSRFDEAGWRGQLGRLRLGAEPIEEQLARLRRVTIALTVIPSAIGLMFVAIFAAFGRVDVGLVVAGILVGPVVGLAWWEDARTRAGGRAYLRARADHDRSG